MKKEDAVKSPVIVELERHVRHNWRQAIFSGAYDTESHHKIGIRKNFNTACWAWLNGAHNIQVGDQIFDRHNVEGEEERRFYSGAYLRHELAHARWTDRDLKNIKAECNARHVPFGVLNLLEDARIEHLERESSGERFGWIEFEGAPTGGKPLADFFCLVQAERGVLEGEAAKPEPQTVSDFYVACCLAPSTMAVVELAQKWMAKFPDTTEPEKEHSGAPSGGGGSGESGDSSEDSATPGTGVGGSGNPADSETEKGETEKGEGEDGGGDADGGSPEEERVDAPKGPEPRHIDLEAALEALIDGTAEVTVENLVAHTPGAMDGSESSDTRPDFSVVMTDPDYPSPRGPAVHIEPYLRIHPKIEKLADAIGRRLRLHGRTTRGWVSTETPGKRLSVRGMVTETNEFRRRKQAKVDRKMKMNVFVDLSGSMGGTGVAPIAAAMVLALSRMAKRGDIEGHCILHKSGLSVYRLQDMEKVVPSLRFDGAVEGIAGAFSLALPLMKAADVNLCITDGAITDYPPNIDALKRKGIYTLGLYPGEPGSGGEYLKFFDRVVIRPDAETLADVVSGEFKLATARIRRAA